MLPDEGFFSFMFCQLKGRDWREGVPGMAIDRDVALVNWVHFIVLADPSTQLFYIHYTQQEN